LKDLSRRKRIRYLLLLVIIITLPCYCLGLVVLRINRSQPDVLRPTATQTATKTPTITLTPYITYTLTTTPLGHQHVPKGINLNIVCKHLDFFHYDLANFMFIPGYCRRITEYFQ